jgi:hypothetical protein
MQIKNILSQKFRELAGANSSPQNTEKEGSPTPKKEEPADPPP